MFSNFGNENLLLVRGLSRHFPGAVDVFFVEIILYHQPITEGNDLIADNLLTFMTFTGNQYHVTLAGL